MREVILYGPMRAQFGRSFNLDVKSPAEALRALCAVIPGFRKWFNQRARDGAMYHVFVGQRNVSLDTMQLESDSNDPIRIAPTVQGSKGRLLGVLTIIAGVALMVFTGNPILFQIGIGLTINGVAQLLVPTPKTPADNSSKKDSISQVYDGPVNGVSPGNVIPVLYGTLEVGGLVASGAIYTEDIGPILTGPSTPQPPSTGLPRDETTDFARWNP